MKPKLIVGDKLIWDYDTDYAIVLFVSKRKDSYTIAHTQVEWTGKIIVNQFWIEKKYIKKYNKRNMDKIFIKYHSS